MRGVSDLEDFERLRRWCSRSSDHHAYCEELLLRHHADLYRYLKHVSNEDDAERIAIAAFEDCERFESLMGNYRTFRTLLFACAYAHFDQALPRPALRDASEPSARLDSGAHSESWTKDTMNSTMVGRDKQAGLHALAELDKQDRHLVILYHYHDFSLDELGDIFRIAPEELEGRLKRAWTSVRDAYDASR